MHLVPGLFHFVFERDPSHFWEVVQVLLFLSTSSLHSRMQNITALLSVSLLIHPVLSEVNV